MELMKLIQDTGDKVEMILWRSVELHADIYPLAVDEASVDCCWCFFGRENLTSEMKELHQIRIVNGVRTDPVKKTKKSNWR